MPKISTFLNDAEIHNLREISKKSGKSISKISAELIEIGYKIRHHQETQKLSLQDKNKQELIDRHTEYLLRLLAITTDIYRCIRNDKSQYEEDNIPEVIKTIKADIAKEIEVFLNRTQ